MPLKISVVRGFGAYGRKSKRRSSKRKGSKRKAVSWLRKKVVVKKCGKGRWRSSGHRSFMNCALDAATAPRGMAGFRRRRRR